MKDSNIIPYIVGMTQQTDRISLIFQLLISINKLTNATEARLLDFQHEHLQIADLAKEWVIPNTANEPLNPSHYLIAMDAIPGIQPFIAKNLGYTENHVLINPVTGRDFYFIENESSLYSVLVMSHKPGMEFDHELVSLFVEMFKNLQKNILTKDQDPLTGLFNRRSFDETISQILDQAIYGAQPNRCPANGACLAIFDIDFFKRINDNYGHAIGDEVLILFARLMERVFRQYDRLYRFGGEEFIAILTEVDLDKAHHALERFRTLLEELPFPQVGKVTVSIGATMVNRHDFPPVLIEKADKALYYAKEHGRNQLRFHETLVAEGLLMTTDHTSDNIEIWV